MQVVLLASSARLPELDGAVFGEEAIGVLTAPPLAILERAFAGCAEEPRLDLVVGNTMARGCLFKHQRGPHFVELGFPCFHRHALFDSPYLGFQGWAWFVDAMLGALSTPAQPAQRG